LRKGKTRPKLSIKLKMAVVYEYLIKHSPAAQVGRRYRISPQYVSLLVRLSMKKPKIFEELMLAKEEEQLHND